VFHVLIWGSLELFLGGLSPQNPPRGDGTGLNSGEISFYQLQN